MPYITPERRIPEEKRGYVAKNAGELNYAITRLCDLYIRDRGMSYEALNAVVGALECAKLEFNRRMVAPYEDDRERTNGDVYAVWMLP